MLPLNGSPWQHCLLQGSLSPLLPLMCLDALARTAVEDAALSAPLLLCLSSKPLRKAFEWTTGARLVMWAWGR